MGIFGAMPLLSTLAALVIIVHSAEEDLYRGVGNYDHDVRSRLADAGTPGNDELWRVVETEPMMQNSPLDWEETPERPVKRRKPARKRKRRPLTDPEQPRDEWRPEDRKSDRFFGDTTEFREPPHFEEDEHHQESNEPLRYRDTEYNVKQPLEKPLRRRRPDRRNRFAEDYADAESPMRRRGQTRRKRPSLDNTPHLREFNDFHADDGSIPIQHSTIDEERLILEPPGHQYVPQKDNYDAEQKHVAPKTEVQEDDRSSVFSMDIEDRNIEEPENSKVAVKEKASSLLFTNFLRRIRDEHPIDPAILREILKRSNGTSLSEILQQHNLSLSDLLRGKDDALSMPAKMEKPSETYDSNLKIDENNDKPKDFEDRKEVLQVTVTFPGDNEPIPVPEENINKASDFKLQNTESEPKQRDDKTQEHNILVDAKETNTETDENKSKNSQRQRVMGARRKLRLRPIINGTYKSQLNRDLMAQTARKYHNNRNITKAKEWKHIIPIMNTIPPSEELNNVPSTTTSILEETTVYNGEYSNPTTTLRTQSEDNNKDINDENDEIATTMINTTEESTTVEVTTSTIKPIGSRLRPNGNRMGLRRQAFNNKLKRKRMKQKRPTTEIPVEYNGFLVSSSEFIARTQTPKPSPADDINEDFTTLDDFMTTERSRHDENGARFTRNSSAEVTGFVSAATSKYISTTEETAKFEIEEIFNDTRTSAKLSRILKERNMTVNELVEHRERGSSHVHLADIFHNASKEPNPPEPFLSKSLIEPISKETYPLRAILEANLHDSVAKATESSLTSANIPVVMNFGNNVNENGENMGIMSLFDQKSSNDVGDIETNIGKDSDGTTYVTTVILINNTDANETTTREGKTLNEENNLSKDVVAWNQLFNLMRMNQQNESNHVTDLSEDDESNHQILMNDSDGDGLIILDDLRRLQDIELSSYNEESVNVNFDSHTDAPGILERSQSHTRSVTVATASIVGLAIILFLLTYAFFKWRQQRNLLQKKQIFPDERIPPPVFENRKGSKHRSSTRSMSPMLATSNIYTLNTLDSNGKESPDYMWDSLRKPFQ